MPLTIYCGVDFHARQQTVAYCDTADGELHLGELDHERDEARSFYSSSTAAWVILRRSDPATAALHDWATQVRQRRGACVAAVALARKLAGTLYAMWRDGTRFEGRGAPAAAVGAAAAA